ncbi:MAG: formate--tetrahydrofolate ligase [Planctomycetes bacterium]|nr:formate--tetrahydrofolate ligase [Planctomycetota bacterium]
MKFDPRKMKDWQIAEAAELNAKPITRLASGLGLLKNEIIPMGRLIAKIDCAKVLDRLAPLETRQQSCLMTASDGLSLTGLGTSQRAKYIDVTAITPTPFGEGKTTTTIGIVQGLAKLGKTVCGAIRQPSNGPTFNIKGSAAGGGLSQCVPLVPLSIRFTGDIDSITNANNLAMVALTSRMQHENNYDDARLAKSGLKRLDIDPKKIQMKWVIDFCAQSLRNIIIGRGGKMDGLEMDSGFAISASSELMAILAVSKDLPDMRSRIAKIVVACDKKGREVTTADLEVDGAMAAWMAETINPNLVQTIEGQPVFVHAGPFANIAIGQSSIIADMLGTKLADYHITESGFGADVGYEKFWNLKCRMSGLAPDAVVIVATIRALKMHGGGPAVKPGAALSEDYTKENLELVEKGCENLIAHIEIVKKSGIRPVVCINSFGTDSKAETEMVKKNAEQNGTLCAVSNHWLEGGKGAIQLAEMVISAAEEKNNFKFLYELETPLRKRIEIIAKQIYGADGVEYTLEALKKVVQLEKDPQTRNLGACMAKTHLSLSHDPNIKGKPKGWTLPVKDIIIYKGAGFIVPVIGDIKLMPGTASNPTFRNIDIDVETGKVKGLF